jgi:putative FmdB family regulatory protein
MNMPIYEYQCLKCGHQFETIRKVSDPVLADCPACGEKTLKKLVSKAAFRLKGGGWYETDFKSGGKKNVAGDEKKTSGESSAPADTAASKPATDSTPKSESAKSSGTGSAE